MQDRMSFIQTLGICLKRVAIIAVALLSVSMGAAGQRPVAASDLKTRIKKQKGLVAFWDFADSLGKPIAGSAKGLQLQPFGNTSYTAEGPISGKAIELDGKTTYWRIPNAKTGKLDIKSNAVTVIAWVQWYGGTGFVAGSWNEYEDGGKRQYGLFVSLPHYNGDSQVCGHISKNGGPTAPFPYSIDYSASPQKVTPGEWTCVAFTYDGSYIKSYYNGVFLAREPELIKHTAGFLKDQPEGIVQVKNPYHFTAGMGNNGADFTIGAVRLRNGMGNFFKGKIGGLAIFDVALNEQAMMELAIMPEK